MQQIIQKPAFCFVKIAVTAVVCQFVTHCSLHVSIFRVLVRMRPDYRLTLITENLYSWRKNG